MRKTNLDERQLQKRNKIGNQTLFIISYLLLADMGLHGYGVHWLDYPFNNYFIFLIGLGSYLVRIIWQGSYIGPGNSNITSPKKEIYAAILGSILALSVLLLFLKNPAYLTANKEVNNSAVFIIAASVGLVILSITYIIRRNNKK